MESLIKKIQEGDEIAFKQLSQIIEKDLYRIAKTRLKDDDDIKDAIQNTMLITYSNCKKIRNVESFKYWMFRVLINECNKIYKKNKKHLEIFKKINSKSIIDDFDNSITSVDSNLTFETLLEKLNYKERLVITLYYNNQYSCKEISRILKTSENTIKSRLNRGKEKIKKYCEEVKIYDIR